MYEQFYHFSAEPFRLSPDHSFAYAHKGYNKARAYMTYAFLRAEGFVMITGRPGTGKTTLIGTLIAELANKTVTIANLVCTQLQADDLLKLVAYDFGISPSIVEKGELLQRLTQQLKAWHRDGRRALLIVDEAQDLPHCAMEELRLLTNIQVDARPLLQIFLLGQPELRELVLNPRMEQVHQRIIAATHLQGLASDETEDYVRHRLEIVRWRGDPAISKSVYPLIYHFSEGVPRRINLICSRLLLHCAVEQRHQVTVADMRTVVQELQDEKLASGNRFAESDFLLEDVFDEDNHASAAYHHGDNGQQRPEIVPELKVIAGRSQFVQLATSSARGNTRAAPIPAVAEGARPIREQSVAGSLENRPPLACTSASPVTETSQPADARQQTPPLSVLSEEIDSHRETGSTQGQPHPQPASTWPIMTALLVATLVIAWAIGYFDVAILAD